MGKSKRIVVIGDSHVNHNYKGDNRFIARSVGPRTAYRLNAHVDEVFMDYLVMYKSNPILFLFGEIDCRIHIHRQWQDWSIGCINTASAYVRLVDSLRQVMGLDISILTVPPTGEQDGSHFGYNKVPNKRQRIVITRLLNACLLIQCETSKIPVVNIYWELVDECDERKPELISDLVHLNNKVAEITWRYLNEEKGRDRTILGN